MENRPEMTTYERHQTILRLIKDQGSVRISELAALFKVSEGTVRNDLSALERQRQLTRIRGGAISNGYPRVAPQLESRAQVNADAKKKIARWASELVSDGEVLLLDASSTAYHVAGFLRDRHNVTVVTNHLETARLLVSDPTKRVILLGGDLRPDGLSVSGEIGQEVMRNLHINTAFLSCVGLSVESGLMEGDIEEARLKQQIMRSASRVVALVDSSKFGKVGLRSFASIHEIAHLVTDDHIDARTVEQLRRSNVSLTICGETTVKALGPQDSTRRRYKIGFANESEELPFAVDVRRGLERAAKAISNIDLIYVDNNLDGNTAIRLADELIAQNVDLVIEYQIDEAAGNLIMDKFRRANIPVIAIDIPMIGATYFGADNFMAGKMAGTALGRWIKTHWGGAVDYVVALEEKRAGALPAARIQGQFYGLEEIIGEIPAGRRIYLDSGNNVQTSFENVHRTLFNIPPQARLAFVCFNDDAAIGALKAVRELGREQYVAIVGQNADRQIHQEIRDPNSPIIGSTAFMPERYGERILEIAVKLLAGEQVPPAVYVEHTFIDANNINRFYPG